MRVHRNRSLLDDMEYKLSDTEGTLHDSCPKCHVPCFLKLMSLAATKKLGGGSD